MCRERAERAQDQDCLDYGFHGNGLCPGPGLRLVAETFPKSKKGGRSRPFQQKNANHHTIRGTISSATMLMILMSGFTAGPAVSL